MPLMWSDVFSQGILPAGIHVDVSYSGGVNFDHMAKGGLPSFSTIKLPSGKYNCLNQILQDLIGFL